MNRAALLLATSLLVTLSACSDPAFDENSQVGPNPALPDPKQFLLPPINVAAGIGWKKGEAPVVAAGLTIKALATGLAHPRFVYVLPNGDILAVQAKGPPPEPVKRPKDPMTSVIKKAATSYPGGVKAASRITLIRDANGDGVPELVTTLIDKLTSPFGVAWIDNTLYVANIDAVVAYPYMLGQTTPITVPAKTLTPLPGGPINHHWTKSLVLSPDGQRLTPPSAPIRTSSRTASRRSIIAPQCGKSTAPRAVRGCSRPACAILTARCSTPAPTIST